ncbi:hypothetical protein LZ554_003613 [Drepanopeziza brunnea f. sp. 'monogermtubi']|nr:hypothetical protein LZ554_003613 [Drepanopeziza brunnea f. sp. 'monogermtubi']
MRPPFLPFQLLLQASSPLITRAQAPKPHTAVYAQNQNQIPIPPLSYPICRRNFTCSAPHQQDFHTIMADLKQEHKISEEVDRLAKPASTEAEMLNGETGADVINNHKKQAESEKAKEKEEVEKEEKGQGKPPKLSAAEFRAYNSMADHMEYFHNHFRQSWTLLYKACENNARPRNLSLRQLISTGLQFCSHLATHHAIEEQHIFPVLATKMPEFRQGKNAAELLRQHEEIHKGMDEFEAYLEKCKSGETELQLSVLKAKMDSWGTVLWTHLDQEVKTLGAENMRKYWTVEEMKRMPM